MLENRKLVTFRKEKGSTNWERKYGAYWSDEILFLDLVDGYICAWFVVFHWVAHSYLIQFSEYYTLQLKTFKKEYVFWYKGIGKLSLVFESIFFLLYYHAFKEKSEIISVSAKTTSYILRHRLQIHLQRDWKMHYNMQRNTEKIQKEFSCHRIKDIAELWKNMMIKTKRIREVVCQIDLTFHADELLSIPQWGWIGG